MWLAGWAWLTQRERFGSVLIEARVGKCCHHHFGMRGVRPNEEDHLIAFSQERFS